MIQQQEYTLEDGKILLRFARNNLEYYLSEEKKFPIPQELQEKYSQKRGAFVTLNKTQEIGNPLRGCVGYILPIKPLIQTVQEMSISAAVNDSRFPKVSHDELASLKIEISILSVPEEILGNSLKEIKSQIKIGRDGLIITQGHRSGLLLPQVPVEHDRNWDVETFLEHTCNKAWLPPDAWQDTRNTKIEKFSATIFEEETPGGEIRQKEIGE